MTDLVGMSLKKSNELWKEYCLNISIETALSIKTYPNRSGIRKHENGAENINGLFFTPVFCAIIVMTFHLIGDRVKIAGN
jgi:hypothetical protein